MLRGRLDPALQHASSIRKPQLDFKTKVVNDDTLWYPTLKHKWNALVPLGYVYRDDADSEAEPV
jgi:exosome complex exonuclease RRP6